MIYFDYIDWDDESNPKGNVQHIATHNLTVEEVESVLWSPSINHDDSRSSGRPIVFGRTDTGRDIVVVYELYIEGGFTGLRPITAYPV